MPIAQVFLVFESTSGRVAVVARLASLGERFQGKEGKEESCGAGREREAQGDVPLGQRVATRRKRWIA